MWDPGETGGPGCWAPVWKEVQQAPCKDDPGMTEVQGGDLDNWGSYRDEFMINAEETKQINRRFLTPVNTKDYT